MAKRLLAALLLTVAVLVVAVGSSSAASSPRIDLKVLVLSPGADAGGLSTWKAQLRREGVPYDVVYGTGSGDALTPGMLSNDADNHAYYEGVVVVGADASTDWDATLGPTGAPPGFSRASWDALHAFELRYGVRQFTLPDWTGGVHGYLSPSAGTADGIPDATLTDAGKQVYPELRGPVNVEQGSWVMLTRQCDVAQQDCNAQSVTPLLTDTRGNELMNAMITKDGREELVSTVKDSGPMQAQAQLLTDGLINWVTKGMYLGTRRNYLEVHVDDIFLADTLWDATTHTDPGDATTPDGTTVPEARMTASDVSNLVSWQQANKLKLDMVFNGSGAAGGDPLTTALLQNKNQFWWINHTWSHLNLNKVVPLDPTSAWVSQSDIESEIQQNIDWAAKQGLPFDRTELVTGEHSGLLYPLTNEMNPNMPAALTSRGIKTAASDISRQPEPYTVGTARTVPRYPTGVYYNAATWQQELDEYSWLYTADDPSTPNVEGGCVATATTTCFGTPGQPIAQATFVDSEATNMLRHVLDNDPRPHYAHQSNLTQDRILLAVLDEVLRRYNAAYNSTAPIQQLKQQQISDELTRQANWRAAVAAGTLTAYLQDGVMHITNAGASAIQVPVTGMATVGTLYGGHRSGWTTVQPGVVALSPYVAPSNTSLPTISGQSRVGSTLTASTGTWAGVPAPTTFTYQWQRRVTTTGRNGTTTISNITGATASTYKPVAADAGSQLRVVVTASNLAGTGSATSAWSGNVR